MTGGGVPPRGTSGPFGALELWKVAVGGDRVENLSAAEITQAFHAGRLSVRSPVWRPGSDGWRALGSFDELLRSPPSRGSAPPPELARFEEGDGEPTRMWQSNPEQQWLHPTAPPARPAPSLSLETRDSRPSAPPGPGGAEPPRRPTVSPMPSPPAVLAPALPPVVPPAPPMREPAPPMREPAPPIGNPAPPAPPVVPMAPAAAPMREPAPPMREPALLGPDVLPPSSPRPSSRGRVLPIVALLAAAGLLGVGLKLWSQRASRADNGELAQAAAPQRSTAAVRGAEPSAGAAPKRSEKEPSEQAAANGTAENEARSDAKVPAQAEAPGAEDKPEAKPPPRESKSAEPRKRARTRRRSTAASRRARRARRAAEAAAAAEAEAAPARAPGADAPAGAAQPPADADNAAGARASSANAPADNAQPRAEGASTIDTAAAKSALEQASKLASSCRPQGGPSGSGRARIRFGNNGAVESVEIVTEQFQDTLTGSCVRMLFRRSRIPPFEGNPPTFLKEFEVPAE